MSEDDTKSTDNTYEVQHLPPDGTETSDNITIWIKNHGMNKISYANGDTFEGKNLILLIKNYLTTSFSFLKRKLR